MSQGVPHPPIVSPAEWRAARVALLEREKALTREYDAIAAARRRLPMARVAREYTFRAPEGEIALEGLFDGKRQLLVYHFMFDPEWEEGCPSCTGYVDGLRGIPELAELDTAFAIVSRAPIEKIERYRAARGWPYRWVSSYGSPFNYDLHVTADPAVAPVEYNYRDAEAWRAKIGSDLRGELPGLSVFFRLDDEPDPAENGIYHTYSAFARGVDAVRDTYRLLDVTPYGRQESFEDSPEGWPQSPTYG